MKKVYALICAALILFGAFAKAMTEKHSPTSQTAEVTATVDVAKGDSVNFTVLQFNVWQEGTSVPGGYQAIIDEIARINPDFVTLSEVRNYNEPTTAKMCRDLEKKTGVKYYTFNAYDNTIISRHLLGNHTKISYNGGDLYKVLTSVGGKRVALYSAHLDYTHYACYYPRGYNGNFQKIDGPVTDVNVIRENNLASSRDEGIAAFLKDAKAEEAENSLIFLGGDFNEPSMLDWGEDMKNLYDHHGVVYEWDQSKTLLSNGYKDAYRVAHPNPVTHPGISYPSDNKDVAPGKLSWTPEADERERIDFIYYYPRKDLSVVGAKMVGPVGTIAYNKRMTDATQDEFITPLGVWPSDHKAVLIEFKLKNVDADAIDIEYPKEEQKAVVESSTPDRKICYRIKSTRTGLYASRGIWGKDINLVDEEQANIDPCAYWWFEDGAELDDNYVVRNLGSKDNFCLFALDNNFRQGDGTEWYIEKEKSGTYVINWNQQSGYYWTETISGIRNNSGAATEDQGNIHWILEKVASENVPAAGVQVSTNDKKYYYTLLNTQSCVYVAKAGADAASAAIMEEKINKSSKYYWFFESTGKDNEYYIKNAAYPDLYFGNTGFDFGKTPVKWTFTPSESSDFTSWATAFVLRREGDNSKVLSYSRNGNGAPLTLWEGQNDLASDSWIMQIQNYSASNPEPAPEPEPDGTDNKVVQLDGRTHNLCIGMDIVKAPWTLELWVRSDVNKRKSEEFLIAGGEYTALSIVDNEALKLVNGKLTAPRAKITDSTPLDGEWHHVALTCDGAKTTLYRDGEAVGQSDISYSILPGTIGVGEDKGTFSGQLDEVRIWKSAISQDMLKQWAGQSLSSEHPNYSTLLGYYPLDDLDEETSINWVGRGHLPYHVMNRRCDYNAHDPLATIKASSNKKFKIYDGAQRLFNAVSVQSEWDCDKGSKEQQMLKLRIAVQGKTSPLHLTGIDLNLESTKNLADVQAVHVYSTGTKARSSLRQPLFGQSLQPQQQMVLTTDGEGLELHPGINYVLVTFDIADNATLGNQIGVQVDKFYLDGKAYTPETTPCIIPQEVTCNNSIDENILKVFQWNIWHGGVHLGNQGQDRVVDLAQAVNADVICMQEAYGIQNIAQQRLGYKIRTSSNSANLSLYTRLPLDESVPMRNPFYSTPGIVTMKNGHKVLMVDSWLQYSSNPEYTWTFPEPNQNTKDWVDGDKATSLANIKEIVSKDIVPYFEPGMSVVIGGDFNSTTHLDWTDRAAHLHYGYGKVDFPTSMYMLDNGYEDSFRKVHPNEVARPEGTWAAIYGHSQTMRIDFLYSKGQLRPIQSKIVRTSNEIDFVWASDHSAVMSVFEYVPYVENPRNTLQFLLDKHTALEYDENFTPGNKTGNCDGNLLLGYKKTIQEGKALLKDESATDKQLEQAIKNINDSYNAVKASVKQPETGYYYLINANVGFMSKQHAYKACYMNKDGLGWKTLNLNDPDFVFKLTKQEDGSFSIQGKEDGRFVNGLVDGKATISEQNTVTQSFFPVKRGCFYIVDGTEKEHGGTEVYHTEGHASGDGVSGKLVGWYADYDGTSSSSWFLVKVDDLDLSPVEDVTTSTKENKVCYLIQNMENGKYVVRDKGGVNFYLTDELETTINPSAYWWFEKGTSGIENSYFVHNLGTDDDYTLYSLNSNFYNDYATEWKMTNDVLGGGYIISYGNDNRYDWTVSGNRVMNKSLVSESTNDKWKMVKVDPSLLPADGLRVSNDKVRYYYTFTNMDVDNCMMKASQADSWVTMDIKTGYDACYYWYLESAGKDNEFYIKNAIYPDKYLGFDGKWIKMLDKKEPWTSDVSSAAVKNDPYDIKYTLKNKVNLRLVNYPTYFLSYTTAEAGSYLVNWTGSNSNLSDTWGFQEVVVPILLDSIQGHSIVNAPGKCMGTFSAPFATAKPEGVSAYYVKQFDGGRAVMTENESNVLAANVGYVLTSESEKPHYFRFSTANAEAPADNMLVATGDKETALKSADYILDVENGATIFRKASDNENLGAFRAFLGNTALTDATLPLLFVRDAYTLTITDAGYATFSAPQAYTLPAELKGGTVEVNGNTAVVTYVHGVAAGDNVVAAGEALLIKGAPGQYTLQVAESADKVEHAPNALKPAFTNAVIKAPANTKLYIFAKDKTEGLGFYFQGKDGDGSQVTNIANKAYLEVPVVLATQGFRLVDGEFTGIENIVSGGEDGSIYTISGTRVNLSKDKLPKGLYIINGTKVLIQ